MGKQAQLREIRMALRHAVLTGQITEDRANDLYRVAKGKGPEESLPIAQIGDLSRLDTPESPNHGDE